MYGHGWIGNSKMGWAGHSRLVAGIQIYSTPWTSFLVSSSAGRVLGRNGLVSHSIYLLL